MKTPTLLKYCTFFLFILLIGVFVSYRSGAFLREDEHFAPLPMTDTAGLGQRARADSLKQDSIIKSERFIDSLDRTLMWSSKSIPVTEPRKHHSKVDRKLMESTKLGRIFTRKDTLRFKKDTIMLLKKEQ